MALADASMCAMAFGTGLPLAPAGRIQTYARLRWRLHNYGHTENAGLDERPFGTLGGLRQLLGEHGSARDRAPGGEKHRSGQPSDRGSAERIIRTTMEPSTIFGWKGLSLPYPHPDLAADFHAPGNRSGLG